MSFLRHLLVAFLFILPIYSCKKTDNDPLISLRSRKARVIGEWTAESGKISGDGYVYTINGNTFIYNEQGYSQLTGAAAVSFLFEKDGKCEVVINLSSYLLRYEGYWNFTGGVGEVKNKTQIVIHFTKVKSSSGTYTYTGNRTNITFDIVECRNKKLRLSLIDEGAKDGQSIFEYRESWDLVQK